MKKNTDVGVVVGRFQTDNLHKGHLHLLEFARARHKNFLVVLGVPRSFPTPRNPLSYEIREVMLKKAFPQAVIRPLVNHPSDAAWSATLDSLIEEAFPGLEATLYGSRDSFLRSYTGKHPKFKIPPFEKFNGAERRRLVSGRISSSGVFRRGIIYAQTKRSPIAYPTIDVAVINGETGKVLLAGKETDGKKLRFVGGFVDAKDASMEFAARRELSEEVPGIEVEKLDYIGSSVIDDWRYRDSDDGIITSFFSAVFVFGNPKAADDIVRLRWVRIDRIMKILVDEHLVLGEMLLKHLQTKRRKP